MSADRMAFLERVPLFRGLQNKQLKKLANRFVSRSYGAGETIVAQGAGGEGLFVVVSGKADAVFQRPDGEKNVVNSFGPTDFFGEIALLSEGVRTASVVAAEQTDCLVLTRWDFLAVMNDDAEMGVTISKALARKLRMAMETM